MPQNKYTLALAGLFMAVPVMEVQSNQYGQATASTTVPSEMPELFEGDILTAATVANDPYATRSIGAGHIGALWEDGVMPYYVNPRFEQSTKDLIQLAVDKWNEVSTITLLQIDDSNISQYPDYVNITPGPGCASWVGKQGGKQDLWVAPSCTGGSLMHEIGHALGLEHEHTRMDRDQYVIIHWNNIKPSKVANFDIANANSILVGDYDYQSIMHYGEKYFSMDGGITIEPINYDGPPIGQRDAPSDGDLATIADLYTSDVSLVAELYNNSGQSELSLFVSNNHLQGANGLKVTMDTGDATLLSADNTDWVCIADAQPVTCELDRLAGSGGSRLGLQFDGVVDTNSLNAMLSSKTADSDPSNNRGEILLAASSMSENDVTGGYGESDALYSDLKPGAGGGSAGAGGGGGALSRLMPLIMLVFGFFRFSQWV